ncbi:hypothetical protein B9Z55_027095 [Caenorhabditis nigoni]|uniref:Uncharacterized protein n=1 Tax=Caenorhabditis nigoni TaxID=1611254 RepID=A0A2G5SJ82_9PELO|nr:hypothetical protein B9Z55_027095 [Caenorhabditis nigoni]
MRLDQQRILKLEQESGCEVRVVYQCEVKAELRRNSEMMEFFDNYKALDILQCNRAFAGGRTEVFRVIIFRVR